MRYVHAPASERVDDSTKGRQLTKKTSSEPHSAPEAPSTVIDLSEPSGADEPQPDYARSLGERLRNIRTQKGMSLHDVQTASEGRWKAAVVGAYERGDRNVTVARLAELAEFYGVPISEVLPEEEGTTAVVTPDARRRVILDLAGLEKVPQDDRDPLSRFTTAIQIQRGDYNGRVLTIREDDLMSLSLLYQTTASELTRRLEEWGMIYSGESSN